MIRNCKSKHPIPEKDYETTSDDEDNPDEDVGKKAAQGSVDVECHGTIMEDVDEEDGKREPCGGGFDENEASEVRSIDLVHLVSQTYVQSENDEEVGNQE